LLVFIPSDHKNHIIDHCSLVHSVDGEATLNMSQYYHNSEDTENQQGANKGRCILFIPVIHFTVAYFPLRQTKLPFFCFPLCVVHPILVAWKSVRLWWAACSVIACT
jgi:hypothetical protein